MAVHSRHNARIAALQALYEFDSSRHEALEALERTVARDRLSQNAATFARGLIEGVLSQQDEIDRIIGEAAPAWPVGQLAAVDRNILRLAIQEMLGDNGAPVRVVINEAVELAKKFGSESSYRFVNGVLGSVEKQRHNTQESQTVVERG